MAQRLLFLDIAKGLAIIIVILNHILVLGVWFNPGNALEVLPLWLIILLSPLIILATMGGFFELMSGLSNMYNMHDRLVAKGQTFKQAVQGPFVNSTALIAAHLLFVTLFAHRRNAPYPRVGDEEIHTLITGSIEQGQFQLTSLQYLYYADILGSIGLAGYLSIIMIWILHRFDLLRQPTKAIRLLFATGVVFFTISYPIWNWGFRVVQDLLIDGSVISLLLAKPLSMLTGSFQPFFPIGGYAFFGSIFGLLLAARFHYQQQPVQYDRPIPTLTGFVKIASPLFFGAFVILLIHYLVGGGNPLDLLNYYRIPPTLLAFNTGLMLIMILLAIKWFEEPPEEVRITRAQRTLFIRRLGLVTLSIYILESVVNGIVSYSFHRLYDDPTTEVYESHTATIPILAYIIIVFGFWFTIVPLWERIGFKYSLEYFFVKIGSRYRSSKSNKLNYKRILYDSYMKQRSVKKKPMREINPSFHD